MDFMQRVREHKTLKLGIDSMIESDHINLTHSSWLIHLQNSGLYQRYLNNEVEFLPVMERSKYVKSQRVKNENDFLKIVVIGRFVYVQTEGAPNFQVINCEPLDKISEVFLDKSQKFELSYKGRFFIQTCNPVICARCAHYETMYRIKFGNESKWWCIEKTKIFNGEDIKLVTRNHVELTCGKNPFIGIFQMYVNARQIFGTNFNQMKINGVITDMILLKESALEIQKPSIFKFVLDVVNEHDEKSFETSFKIKEENYQTVVAEQAAVSKDYSFEPNFQSDVNEKSCETSVKTEDENYQTIVTEQAAVSKDYYSFEPNFQRDVNICLPKTVTHKEVTSTKRNDDNDDDGDYPLMYVKKFKFEAPGNP